MIVCSSALPRRLCSPHKTELIWFGSRTNLQKLAALLGRSLTVTHNVVQSVKAVRDLGVTLDSELSIQNHVNKVTCFYHIRRLKQVRKLLMPGFQHYVSGVPEPFCRCRPAVAVLPLPFCRCRSSVSVAVSCRSNGIGWKPLSVDDGRQPESVAVFAVASTEEIKWFNPVPWDDFREIFIERLQMVIVPNGMETLPKISIGRVGCTNVTHRRQRDGRTTRYSERER